MFEEVTTYKQFLMLGISHRVVFKSALQEYVVEIIWRPSKVENNKSSEQPKEKSTDPEEEKRGTEDNIDCPLIPLVWSNMKVRHEFVKWNLA